MNATKPKSDHASLRAFKTWWQESGISGTGNEDLARRAFCRGWRKGAKQEKLLEATVTKLVDQIARRDVRILEQEQRIAELETAAVAALVGVQELKLEVEKAAAAAVT